MEWVFMVEQPRTSFTSSSPRPKRRLKRVAGNDWNTDIWDNPVLPILWPPFGEGPSLFYCGLMASGLEPATSIPASTLWMNWNSRISLQNVVEHLSRTVEVAKMATNSTPIPGRKDRCPNTYCMSIWFFKFQC